MVCTPGFDAFRFHRWLDVLRPTYYSAVPTMHQMVLARAPEPAAHDAAVRSLVVGRAAGAGARGASTSLFDVPVIESYGMTEASHQMTCNPLPPAVAKPGSVGIATGIEVAILDAKSNLLPPGERGEVAIKGATIVDGYENNPSRQRGRVHGGLVPDR